MLNTSWLMFIFDIYLTLMFRSLNIKDRVAAEVFRERQNIVE